MFEDVCALSVASSSLRRDQDPRRALLEHEHEVALELAERHLEFCEESCFSD